ncbi:hypothetical protein A1O1_07776 [Capronia coronata CBS 617.96]|uniref:DUF7924 domain-containing protein n=1 Tax=Capronia coronata CBS 617.96 TaxID=1182541 RepID=W9XXK2_9EURO|nr:uncharacterized protein A1O1_07776 [Capronia coronata CBS 617.96]EXJ81711.1 hypothetical protein A1O1_07776 [Capronia coronata CBS 617.96]
MPPEIHCPRPQRPPIRSFIFDDIEDKDLRHTQYRRTLLYLFPELFPASKLKARSRSDGYLLQTMLRNQKFFPPTLPRRSAHVHDHDPLPRHHSAPVDACRTTDPAMLAATPPSSYSGNESPFPYQGGISDLVSASSSYSDLPKKPSTCSRVRSPRYRQDLLHNKIVVRPAQIPPSILEYGRRIISRARNSPTMPDSQAQAAVTAIRMLDDADESTIYAEYMSMQLLPGLFLYSGKIRKAGNIPFDPEALPQIPSAPPLATPRPDLHYCLDRSNFSFEEGSQGCLLSLPPDFHPFVQPSRAGYWPYFTVEFKSEACRGTSWVAENQNATTGALCVNAMEKLLSLDMVPTGHTEIESVSFSCNINAMVAVIWIHYCQNQQFYSTELEYFHLSSSRAVVDFRNSVRNIVEFGFKDRLPQILALLDSISRPVLTPSAPKSRHTRKRDEETFTPKKKARR